MKIPRFTVLMPTFDHGPMIVHAIESVLAQEMRDFQLVVIGDGAPDATRQTVEEIARRDGRVSYRAFPKGPRTGEEHRHIVLAEVRSPFIAYCADDDIWFPDHLDELARLLAGNDLVNTKPLNLKREPSKPRAIGPTPPAGLLRYVFRTGMRRFQDPGERERMFADPPRSLVGLTPTAHRLSAYRRLPEGWSPAPAGIYTDINMWRKFLRDPACRAFSGSRITSLHFPSWQRLDMSLEARDAETVFWARRMVDPQLRETVISAFSRQNRLAVEDVLPRDALGELARLGIHRPLASGGKR